MRQVCFNDFLAANPAERRQSLADDVALLVTQTPVESAVLVSLASSFGEISGAAAATSPRENREAAGVHLIRALDVPLSDTFGNRITSTSRDPFPLHTDEFFRPDPADLVIMLCCEADTSGGETLLSGVNAITASLPPEQVTALMTPFVRVPFGFTAILSTSETEGYSVAYNRYEMTKFCRTLNHSYTSTERDLLDLFDTAALRSAHRLNLRAGDCLFIDNRHALHGRTMIGPNSKRLLKRVRVRFTGNC